MAHGKDSGSSPENNPNREAPNKMVRGDKKYQDWVAEDTRRIDRQGNMPFQFIKPPRRTQSRRDVFHVCDECGNVNLVNQNTVGTTCTGCRQYQRVEEDNRFISEDELEAHLRALEVQTTDE